ncbi:MAG: hypothetical protein LBV43_07960 [Prevotella sp.]|jgi:hypothetical protein|nr:hypothetical protein [Prevotella sp.]
MDIEAYVHEIMPYNPQNKDSISYELWYATAFLLPEDKIPKIDSLNIIEARLERRVRPVIDSIIHSIGKDLSLQILNNEENDISPLVKEYLKKGDINAYCKVNIYSYSISLYMAEVYSFIPAYGDTFYNLLKLAFQSQKNQIQNITFNEDIIRFLSCQEQDLAIYCLIKSYKKGDIKEAKTLAYYFKEGIYFKKDINIANTLDSIHENRPLVIFK